MVSPVAPVLESEYDLVFVEGDLIMIVLEWARGVKLEFT